MPRKSSPKIENIDRIAETSWFSVRDDMKRPIDIKAPPIKRTPTELDIIIAVFGFPYI